MTTGTFYASHDPGYWQAFKRRSRWRIRLFLIGVVLGACMGVIADRWGSL